MIKEIPYEEAAPELIRQLGNGGAFLTVRNGKAVNAMTIGWAEIGRIWNCPILTVMVRYSRFSYSLIDQSCCFTVSVPADGCLKKELAFFGTKSGRDMDKFARTGLETEPAQSIDCPVLSACHLFFECKTVYRQAMEPATLLADIKEKSYADNDYHVLFFGEIEKAYRKI
ncbi:MAG: flavin reductase family protein [Spirochaetia bacterium]|jgi:flavin reductase (DIM6/NTAB) family NADH-FMN oxidoreductase RutF|nr:flavin reductase family protein [Spirochaetia bacterium]